MQTASTVQAREDADADGADDRSDDLRGVQ
jgi:hypothetical protein